MERTAPVSKMNVVSILVVQPVLDLNYTLVFSSGDLVSVYDWTTKTLGFDIRLDWDQTDHDAVPAM